MADSISLARCVEMQRVLKDRYQKQIAQQNRILRLDERVRVRRGELAEAENILSRIEEAIREVAAGVFGLAADILKLDRIAVARDVVLAATQLANLQARQRQRMANLRHDYENDAFELQAAKEELEDIEFDIRRFNDFLNANCR